MKFKPCPFCGDDDLETQTGTPDREGIPCNVVCCSCGARGPWVYIFDEADDEAWDVWNNRI